MPRLNTFFWCLLAVFLVVATGQAGYGQDQSVLSLDPSKAITQYIHEAWDSRDGLPQDVAASVLQTRDGYLWVGTQEGLARFDGRVFTVFNRKNVDAFSVNTVVEMVEGPDSTLWVGMRGGGLIAYKDGHFRSFTSDDGLSSNNTMALHIDLDGTLWVGTYKGGLNRLRNGTVTTFGEEQGLLGAVFSMIYRDPDGTLWVGTNEGLFHMNGDTFAPAPIPEMAQAFVTAMFVDREGVRWYGTRSGGLFEVTDTGSIDHSAQIKQPDSYLTTIHQDTAGSLWLGLRGDGLLRHRKGRFSAFTTAHGLSNDTVLSLYEDREGTLWIGTKQGLNRLRDSKFTTYTPLEGLSDTKILSLHEDATGTLWIATAGAGINRLRDGQITTFDTEDSLSSNAVLTVGSTPDGAVWFGTQGSGLNRLMDGKVTTLTTEDGLSGNEIYVLYTDTRGHLWIGTEGGFSRYDGHTFETLSSAQGLSSDFVTVILESRDGAYWMGTYDGGLNRLHDGQITTYTTENGLSADAVLSLYEDADGVLWIGTWDGGLSRLKDNRLTTITARDGLFEDTALSILEDDAGNLWMSSNRGLYRAARADLNAFADGKKDRVSSTAYGLHDGLKSVEANGGQQPAAWKSHDGRLWFPTNQGVAMIDPADIRTNPLPPPVVVEILRVDNKVVALTPDLTLTPGSDKIEFDYTALSLAAPDQIRFKYRLEGHDDDWFDAGTRREAFYTNLSPGTYTFRILAANNDGVWNETGAALSFYLKPFFYQTTWFLLLCLAALLGTAFTGYRFRINQMKARERELERVVDERTHDLRLEKERTEQAKTLIEAQADKLRELDHFKTQFFANVSHEFRTPLTMLIGPLENALGGSYGVLSSGMKRQVDIMLRNALRLMRLINQLLDLSKMEAGKMQLKAGSRNIVAFLEGVVLTISGFAEKKNIDLKLERTSEDIELYFEPDKFEKVFYNLLSNASKFTPQNGAITVSVSEDETHAEVRVSDTGKGIPTAQLPYIFDRFHQVDGSNTRQHEGTGIGLALVKEMIELHGGAVSVESEVGAGTSFIIRLPKGRAHLKEDQVITTIEQTEIALPPEQSAMTELATADFDYMHADESAPESRHQSVSETAPLILVVDDNKDVREYVSSILEEQYRVTTAEDGEDGLEKTRTLLPDLVLSDVMMPKMDGNAMCRLIKEDEDLQHIPVILLTARATHELKIEGLEGGADDYMAKPFNARELMVRVRNLITLRQHQKALKLLNENLEQKVQEQLDLLLSERKDYEQRLVGERDKAEASSRLKSSILNNLNHELRTPLTQILGGAEILQEEAAPPLQEMAAMILLGGNRLFSTLDALMELSRLEANDFDPNIKPTDLVRVVQGVVDQFRERAMKQGLSLHFKAPRDQAVMVPSDAALLKRLLAALVDNALKFTDTGGVVIEVAQAPDKTLLRVQDTGIGISPDAQTRIFEAFVQGSEGLNRSYEGVGVGLTIAKGLAERIGGEITVASELEHGSTFTVTLPALSDHPVPPRISHPDKGHTA